MRWFTAEARDDDRDAWDRACTAYAAHLRDIEPGLPAALLAVASDPNYDLKDGRFHEAFVDRDAGIVVLTIDCGNLQVGYRRLTLRFEGATIVPDNLQLVAYAIGAEFTPNHWHEDVTVTEIRAYEVDIIRWARFILRMSLWPFHEFAVEAADVTMTEADWPTRPPAHAGAFTTPGRGP